MEIPIVEAEEVMAGRVRGTGKYSIAIEKVMDFIKQSIHESKDGAIRMKVVDLTKEMGPEFTNKSPTVIFRNLKNVLAEKNIMAELGTHRDGDKLIVMRFKDPAIEKGEKGVEKGEKEEKEVEEEGEEKQEEVMQLAEE
jgi:hypothetical protein